MTTATAQHHSNSKSKSKSKSRSKAKAKAKSKMNALSKMRTIGRWYIGETLGKGGYSWVKKGYDKKTGKCVALKFMAKAEEDWAKEQSKQVVTEIECLKQIRHPNVMKLYAYNLNAKYPSSSSNRRVDAILLVLEYAPGGEIFDILYYTSALEEVLARTYFRQAIFGLEACHNAGVAHRDIKPQNLLLDSRFNLKITDFGLSKVFESDADAIMKTTYVGTKGYQAPELLLDQPFDLACDIFSMAVVLFILITGYPPFEQAHNSDHWFKPIGSNNQARFWKFHHGCAISNNKECKDLLSKMFAYNPKQRITIAQIKKHPWFNGKYLEGKALIRALRHRYRAMELNRKKDARKMGDLNDSYQKPAGKPIPGCENIKVELFPENQTEGIFDTYTTVAPAKFAGSVHHLIHLHNGRCAFNSDHSALDCKLKIAKMNATGQASRAVDVAFTIEWWRSREYFQAEETKEDEEEDEDDEDENEQDHSNAKREQVYCVRMRRVEGPIKDWRSVRSMLFKKAASIFTGLPEWAENLKQQEQPAGLLKESALLTAQEEQEYETINWDEN